MTTKVVKGSLWTLAGQVLPMAVAFVATPFTIRLLGSEAYGVVILVGLIPTYFGFADFGMGIASTKFGSEAYGEGNPKKEGEIVRTAAFIALLTAMAVAVPIFALSSWIMGQFAVPDHLQNVASVALRIASVSFVLGILMSVLNTPMLARLRMDMNSATSTVPKILIAALTPVVLYLGGGILGAIWTGFFAGLIGCALILYFSTRLLPGLITLSINKAYVRPLLKFGAGLVIGTIAAALLVNLEKLALSSMVSVRSLAYYSVAFTFAGMATMFSGAMVQSLLPAFSQLLAPEKKVEFDGLFTRGMRLNLIWLLPAIMVLFVVARPFFTLWAGEEFGRESTLPFYLLLFGLFFNVLAYIPYSTITAKGRTDIFAKLYWIELVIYAVAVFFLIRWFGIVGAAAAWSLRVVLDAGAVIYLARRVAEVPLDFIDGPTALIFGAVLLFPPISIAVFYDNFSIWLVLVTPAALILYFLVIWKGFIRPEEKVWIKIHTLGLLED